MTWTFSGKIVLHPYDLSEESWHTDMLLTHPELSYSLPSFHITPRTAYTGLVQSSDTPFATLGAERFHSGRQLVGLHIFSPLSEGCLPVSTLPNEELISLQLSSSGDLFTEPFHFVDAPSLSNIPAPLWFDPLHHQDTPKPEQAMPKQSFSVQNATRILSGVAERSRRWFTPPEYASFVETHSHSQPSASSQTVSSTQLDSYNIADLLVENESLLEKILEVPSTLFDVWRKIRDNIPDVELEHVYEYLTTLSEPLISFTFSGDQSFYSKNPLSVKLLADINRHRTLPRRSTPKVAT